MRSRATIKWAGLALAGLLIAVGVAIAAGNLAGRQIGLASEPISAGDALAPAASPSHGSSRSGHDHGERPPPTATPAPTTTSPPVETTTPAPPPSVEAQPPAGGEDHRTGGGDSGAEGADD